MAGVRAWFFILAAAAMPIAAHADHACDASIAEPGWKTIASRETVDVKDGAPYQAGGEWFVDRAITTLPLCNYINAAGSYSLRSYSLSPETKTERVAICKGAAPIAPYAGACPPK
jgi:hypothetical protein